jgi:hypothetical protein
MRAEYENSIRIAAAAVALAIAAVAQAQEHQSQEHEVQAIAGQDVNLTILVQVKPDCSPGPIPEFRLELAPANGWIIVRNGGIRIPDAAPKCKGTSQAANALYYRPKPGFTGEDHVSIEVTFTGGSTAVEKYAVTVSPKP